MPDPEVAIAEEVQPEPEANPEEPQESKKGIVIIAAVVVVVLIAGGIFLLVKKRQAQPPKQEAKSAAIEATLPLETFVVNLAGDERAYLRVTMTLGLAHPQVKTKEETGLPVPVVRDTVLTVLSTAHPGELLQPEGKAQLKAQVLQALQARLPGLGVKEVYFTEFLVQM